MWGRWLLPLGRGRWMRMGMFRREKQNRGKLLDWLKIANGLIVC
jgi:hypothetical protein